MLLDNIDLTTLQILQDNARCSYQEIANRLGVSRVTIYERVRKLTENGFIEGFHVKVNARRIGYPVTAIVGLITIQGSEAYRTINELRAIYEVEEIHVVTGRYDYLVKVRARDNEDLQQILLTRIDQVHGFQRAETMVVLSSPVEKCGIDMRQVSADAGLNTGENIPEQTGKLPLV
ncbi:MAG: AsnC family transcriptional regulator [Peptococcaceae bacterium BRH_c8a]|nr:MAG: AsnC family transcriptional regulator [Peptococcaceae bacterium BRH_c8a]